MKLPVPFLQLPLRFDAQRLAAEMERWGEALWRDHPQKYPGNSMLPLIAANGDAGDESFDGAMAPTPELRQSPYMQQVLSSFGAVLGRSRLMRLAGQAEVSPHTDGGYYWAERVRIHVPIRTQPTVRFVCGGETIHMAEGECWIFDTSRQHMVFNDATEQRVHLVADTVGGDEFWSLVGRGRPHDANPPGWQPRHVAPDEAAAPPVLLCERYNLPRVMSPWEMQHHLQELNSQLVDQRSPDSQQMQMASMRLVRAWRSLWAHYADSGEGTEAYRAALQAFLSRLPKSAAGHRLRNGALWAQSVAAVVLDPARRP
jgi:hypothetical protein